MQSAPQDSFESGSANLNYAHFISKPYVKTQFNVAVAQGSQKFKHPWFKVLWLPLGLNGCVQWVSKSQWLGLQLTVTELSNPSVCPAKKLNSQHQYSKRYPHYWPSYHEASWGLDNRFLQREGCWLQEQLWKWGWEASFQEGCEQSWDNYCLQAGCLQNLSYFILQTCIGYKVIKSYISTNLQISLLLSKFRSCQTPSVDGFSMTCSQHCKVRQSLA